MSSIIAFNQYDALPGHKMGFKDKQIKLPREANESPTESILFIGTAADGPVNEPVSVTPETVYQIFGKATNANGSSNGTSLVPAFEEAWLAGCRDIRLMRYSGKAATAQLVATERKESNVGIHVDTLYAQGNKNTEFAVENLEIDETTLVIYADGKPVSPSNVTIAETTDRTVFTIADNTVEAGAVISLAYNYLEDDGAGGTEIVSVIDRNYDFENNPIVANGGLVTAELTQLPQGTVRVYVGAVEVTKEEVFEVTGKTFTFDQTKYPVLRGSEIKVSYSFVEFKDVTPVLNIESVNAGANYNNFTYKVTKDTNGIVTVEIAKPEDKKANSTEIPLKFRSLDFPNLALLANAINNHPYNGGLIEARVEPEFQSVATDELVLVETATQFTGGSDENNLSPDEIYTLLGGEKDDEGYTVSLGAYQTIENYTVDYVVPLGIFADDQLIGLNDNFAYQLALACAVMSHYNSVTMGLISTTAPRSTNLRDVEDHVRKLEVLPNNFLMKDVGGNVITDADGNPIDLGQFIGIVAGPEVISVNTRLGYVANNSPASIAGLLSALDITSAATNKVVKSAQGVRYELSASQLNRLVGARYITLRRKPDGAVVVVDAMTAAQPDSDYTRVATARVIKEVANQVRTIADPYIGEANDIPNRNALAASLDKRLGKLVEAQVISSYNFDIIANAQMELMGEAQVQLSVKVPNELRKITTIVGLSN